MVKFRYLIHKETGTVIKYEDWKEQLEKDYPIIWNDDKGEGKWVYNSKNILFNDDFEIIYDSEFTLEELRDIFRGRQKSDNELMEKIAKNINDREFLKNKYGIEV